MYLGIFLSVIVAALIISIAIMVMILKGVLKFNNTLSAELKEVHYLNEFLLMDVSAYKNLINVDINRVNSGGNATN